MTEIGPDTPALFWDLIDRARPDLAALCRELEALPKDRLISFARAYVEAAQDVCEYSDGPVVGGIQFSEDDTEDLCKWVVSQGLGYWRECVALGGALEPVAQAQQASDEGRSVEHPAWSTSVTNPAYVGYQSPGAVPYAVFEARFGKSLYDVVA